MCWKAKGTPGNPTVKTSLKYTIFSGLGLVICPIVLSLVVHFSFIIFQASSLSHQGRIPVAQIAPILFGIVTGPFIGASIVAVVSGRRGIASMLLFIAGVCSTSLFLWFVDLIEGSISYAPNIILHPGGFPVFIFTLLLFIVALYLRFRTAKNNHGVNS